MSFQEQLEDKTRLNENLEKQLSQRYVFQNKSEKKTTTKYGKCFA